MWTHEHCTETEAEPEAVWRLYSDVSTWPVWDAGIAAVGLAGPFAEGTAGVMTPAGEGQGLLPFHIVDARPDHRFADETELPDAGDVLRFAHALIPLAGGGTRITHSVTITGPAADAVGPQIGPAVTAGIPDTMACLARHALAVARG